MVTISGEPYLPAKTNFLRDIKFAVKIKLARLGLAPKAHHAAHLRGYPAAAAT